jgi:putative NADH-flavin reductase
MKRERLFLNKKCGVWSGPHKNSQTIFAILNYIKLFDILGVNFTMFKSVMSVKKIKKIIVFGATGKTGHQLVRYALEKGYIVTAFLRDRSKLSLKYHNLKIVKGDVLNPGDVERAMKDQDAVISSLGTSPGKPPVCCAGVKNILDAMAKYKIIKLAAISAHGARNSVKGFYARLLNLALKKIMIDKNQMEEVIEKSKSGWTIVRPVIMTNGPYTGNYNVSIDEELNGIHFISRQDTARFIIDSLESRDYLKKIVTIYK